MTQLRRMMLEELQRRNYSDRTIRYYLQAVALFAKHFGKRPDKSDTPRRAGGLMSGAASKAVAR